MLQLEFGYTMRKKRRGTVVRALAGALSCYDALRDPGFDDESCKAECRGKGKLQREEGGRRFVDFA